MPYPSGEDRRYNDVQDYFDKVMQASDAQHRATGDQLALQAERLLGRRGRFLDVGCGRGGVVWAARKHGWDAEGCDISAEFVRYARDVVGVNAHAATLEAMAYPDQTFDVVTLVEVIEHLYNPAETMKELRRVIRPGGLLYISTPNEESIYHSVGNLYYQLRRLDWCVNLCPTWNLYHIYGFSPRSLRYLFKHNGFWVEELTTYPGTTPVPDRRGFWGGIERIGTRAVAQVANLTGKNPYMYAWARREE
jgi:SAM-dependent methyltransferase